MASASTHQLMSQPRTSFYSTTGQLKPMIKAKISGRMVYSGIRDVAISSVHSEKTSLKTCMMII